MEFNIVYRVLRKLSAWVIGGWYSEVHVEGAENVSKTGPLILYVFLTNLNNTLLCLAEQ